VGDSVQDRRPKTPSPRAPKTELTKSERRVLDRGAVVPERAVAVGAVLEVFFERVVDGHVCRPGSSRFGNTP